eukprot:TRINITY_DN9393_c0_g3_i1.p9 TRINITY_DN9393_c0_g3~~TRINITY_DN9393_c0_g3_i1.p9  ORF type:complete len:109 (+),score=14.04 TRINITY_DN9393_c0_g3_i1:328-654(+)
MLALLNTEFLRTETPWIIPGRRYAACRQAGLHGGKEDVWMKDTCTMQQPATEHFQSLRGESIGCAGVQFSPAFQDSASLAHANPSNLLPRHPRRASFQERPNGWSNLY